MMSPTLLRDAARALEALAQGRTPHQAQVLAGSAALDALQLDQLQAWDRDLIEAAQALLARATSGDPLNVDELSRVRAAKLARRLHETRWEPLRA